MFSSKSPSSSSVLDSAVLDDRPAGFLHKKDDELKRESSAALAAAMGTRGNLLHTYLFFLLNDILVFGSDRSSLSSKSEDTTSSKTTPRAWGFGDVLTAFL